MKIVVCVKQVPDTASPVKFKADGTLDRSAMKSILNPDDRAAVEVALRIKDKDPENVEVTALTMGLPKAEEVLREAMAMGCDKGLLITDRRLGGADTWATSSTIAGALKNMEYDLIVAGRQAIDGDTAQVGPEIAEHLGIPCISYASDVSVENGYVTAKRSFDDRYHILKAKLPALLTVLGEETTPRYMTPGGIFHAYDAEITTWGRDDLKVDDKDIGLKGSPTKIVKSFNRTAKGKGVIVTPDSPEEAAEYIQKQLDERHII